MDDMPETPIFDALMAEQPVVLNPPKKSRSLFPVEEYNRFVEEFELWVLPPVKEK
jgi:hypothetical protein